MKLTKPVLDKMAAHDAAMVSSEDYRKDGTLNYAFLSWYTLTEEQKNVKSMELDMSGWKAILDQTGSLGVYHKDSLGDLDRLTGCTRHKELGKSADGNYTYYLSFADTADKTLTKELEKTKVTLTDILKPDACPGDNAFSKPHAGQTGSAASGELADFQTTDINGNTYTKDLFAQHDLTLVNVFATWCSPCVNEMPELEKFKKEMASKGIGVAAIVHDTVNAAGEKEPGIIDTAKQLQKRAKLTFPLLLPDASGMNGRLNKLDGYPTSFFVDKNGNIVGDIYLGAHSFEEWKKIAEKELADLKGGS